MRTRVKICGITREADAMAAVSAGADALGLVFYPPSPRFVSVDQAASIARSIPPFVTKVGLFVDAERTFVEKVVKRVGLDLIQFHGDESPDACAGFRCPWIKAIRMKDGLDVVAERRRYSAASGLLLDTYRPGVPGGTGERFDWGRVPSELADEVILAGGLTPDNVTEAVRSVRPYAVDVSGGVEASKGIKDPMKIKAFMKGVKFGDE